MRTGLLALALVAGCTPPASVPTTHAGFDPIPLPDFSLTERSGETVTKADLEGKVWVAAFVFTRCAGPCPRVSATMARLSKELADLEDVRLVTFTVDPAYDTPKILSDYAERYQADPERWLFLTGQEEQLHRIVREGFMLHREPKPDAPPGERIDHDTRLALVNRDGEIVGFYDGLPRSGGPDAFEENIDRLVAHVRELAAPE